MALHIQMNERAEWEWRRKEWRNKITSAAACLLMVAGGLGILFLSAVLIIKDAPVTMIGYIPHNEEQAPTRRVEPREFSSRSSQSSSVDPAVTVITTPTNTNQELAAVEVDMSEGMSLDSSIGLELGFSDDIGGGWGNSGGGLGTSQSGGSALEGTLYDLKQIGKGRARKPSDIVAEQSSAGYVLNDASKKKYYAAIANFMNKGWSAAQLSKYYEAPQKLYASNFYVPAAQARYAPIAFGVGDAAKPESHWLVKPAGWVVVYRGKVRAPKTGKFRFIGTGDDFIGVRFNRQVVLEGGYRLISDFDVKNMQYGPKTMLSGWSGGKPSAGSEAFLKDIKSGRDAEHKGYELINTVDGIDVWGRELGGLMAGKEFSVKEGEVYPIEILVAEEGGAFGFALFIEDVTKGKNSKARQYDIFRTNFATPSNVEIQSMLQESGCVKNGVNINIPYNEDSYIWAAVP